MSTHGTYTSYQYGCRCQACRVASATYRRQYRRATGNADSKAQNRAIREAARRYRQEHPGDWAALLNQERWKAREENRRGPIGEP